jgi:hypothetical protein
METLIEKIKTLDCKYQIVNKNKILLLLEFNQTIIIELNNDKLFIKNQFIGWNFLTGSLRKDLNFALKFVTWITVIFAIYIFIFNFHNFASYFVITFFIILTIFWYFYYYLKYLFYKKVIFDIWLN